MSASARQVRWVMVDYRCPYCDRAVVGEHEVAHRQRKPRPASCQYCGRGPFTLEWDSEEPIEEMRAWSFEVPPKRRTKQRSAPKAKPRKVRTRRAMTTRRRAV